MLISIITPAFGQLDWLRLCVTSVADQVVGEKADKLKSLKAEKGEGIEEQESADGSQLSQSSSHGFAVEHIIQDAGSPGIEEFAREVGAAFYRDGVLIFEARPSTLDPRPYRLVIYSEPDAGMYDAINKGISKISGDLWAWLNCDEQYLPGTLAYVAQWFEEHPQTDILCGDALLIDADGKGLSYRRIVAPNWHHTRLVHLASLSCASFYKRSIETRGGIFDITWRSIGDAEWMARLIKAGLKINACGRLLSTFAFTGQNTSESPLASREGLLWREAPDAPPEWMKRPVVFYHRLRKILAGAYRVRSVDYAIHQQGHIGRVNRQVENLGWRWPTGEGEKAKKLKDKKAENGEGVGGQESEDGFQRFSVSAFQHFGDLTSFPVLGSPLAVTTYEGLSRKLVESVENQEKAIAVDFANTQVITLRRHDPDFAHMTESIDLTVPDGMPLVWVMNAKGAGLKDRVYGPTFTRKFLESCPTGMTHYLVGGSEECGRRFRERMMTLNPSLDFVGGYHGMCSADGVLQDDEAVLAELQKKRPDFIWVGLGAPKQYAWMDRIKPKLQHGVLLAVGFAFDVNAGMKQDTPLWMQRLGLGWLHRMASEPRRLLTRYLKWNSLFLWYLMSEGMAENSRAKTQRRKG